MASVLVVDDEQSICWGLARLCERLGHQVTTAASAEEGLRAADARAFDVLVLDVRLPGVDGLASLAPFRERLGGAPTIVMTAFGDLDTAVRAVRGGAFEYLTKPFDLEAMRGALERALRRVDAPLATPQPSAASGGMIGRSPAMQALFKRVALAAASDANVVVCGESGVGKELAARAIHGYSRRSAGPFVAVNLAALSPTVIESELFGHADGAFTGASRARPGLLVRADGGTLFLDEVAEIPLDLQVKLLRAIEQGEVLPVGADRPTSARFRVVAATHRDLEAMARAGGFRHDLYFRLNAFAITIPPLVERPDDIPLLAAHFASAAASAGGGELRLAPETLAELVRRPWRGNVRELRNAIEHAAVLARSGVVLPEHLPAPSPPWAAQGAPPARGAYAASLAEASATRAAELLDDPEASGAVYDTLLREVEGPLLAAAMERFGDECAPAARVLGLHRTTLRRKLEQLERPSN